ncbi:MAG: YitT family protein [Bacteroidales bacterium]|nr:YitT family protein [Bacteroidales bacterium]
MLKNKLLINIQSYFLITIGLLCFTTGWTVFVLPNTLVGGGVTGLAAIINYCTGIDVSYTYFVINAVLLLIGFKVLGNAFGAKTIYAIVVTSIFLKFLPHIIPEDFIADFAEENGKLLCAICGGAMSGLGIAITFTQGGSTGGTDIIALIINKYRSMTPGKIIVSIDLVIIASSLIVPSEGSWGAKIATVIYGYVLAGVSSFTLDLVLSGDRRSVQIMIFTKQYAKIADRILVEAHRGVTVLDGQGWFTKQESKVLMVVVRKQELNNIMRIVKEEDKTAFLSVENIMGVYGKGFDQIKKQG